MNLLKCVRIDTSIKLINMTKYRNNLEAGANDRLDRKKTGEDNSIPESMITRAPEAALEEEINLLVANFAERPEGMQEIILKDMNLALNGTEQQAAESRDRLDKAGIKKAWPKERLEKILDLFKASLGNKKGPDYKNDPKYKAFNDLFENKN
jgi:hypothetical protein